MRAPIVVLPLPSIAVTSPFGPRDPLIGGSGFHSGVDLHAAEGTPVRAPFGGIAHTFVSDEGGNIVSIDGVDGWTVNLDHLSSFAFEGPVSVDAGAVVGFSGHSGHTTGPHLHLELRPPPVNGARQSLIDPLPFLTGGGGGGLLLVALLAAGVGVFAK